MNFKIKLNCNEEVIKSVVVTAYDKNGGLDFVTHFNPDETALELYKRVLLEAQDALKNRVVTEKVSVPAPKNVSAEDVDAPKLAKVKYLRERGYIEKLFEGPAGSGKSTRGGQYAAENNLKIVEVVECTDKEYWFYKKKGE